MEIKCGDQADRCPERPGANLRQVGVPRGLVIGHGIDTPRSPDYLTTLNEASEHGARDIERLEIARTDYAAMTDIVEESGCLCLQSYTVLLNVC